MCGIVGGTSYRNVVPSLIEGLKHLEYRGYDSAGVAVLQNANTYQIEKVVGKISELENLLENHPISGQTGIAHTRWATHGKPSLRNAHPLMVGDRVIIVHNGIIENYQALKKKYSDRGYIYTSDTDSEIIACAIDDKLKNGQDFLSSVQDSLQELEGAYALCVMDIAEPNRVIGARLGPPLIFGWESQEYYIASDILAFPLEINNFIYLEDEDVIDISNKNYHIYNRGFLKNRKVFNRNFNPEKITKNGYPHFMLKEIFEQPEVIFDTLHSSITQDTVIDHAFGMKAPKILDKTEHVQIVACGSSYHAGLVARMWLEDIAKIPCQVEYASEFRYRKKADPEPNTLFVWISQSGETADTLAALRSITSQNYCGTLGICNVENSSLARETELLFITKSGTEIGVCATKTFSTQLVALMLLTLSLGRRKNISRETEMNHVRYLKKLPDLISETLTFSDHLKDLANIFLHKEHVLFIGRIIMYPIAQEGALKMKEISYIHAEAYPAGELKHGPLALVDKNMPVIVLAPFNSMLEKLKSNIQEVAARSGELLIFSAKTSNVSLEEAVATINLPEVEPDYAPFVYTVALQLLSYYVGVLKGKDVDQPRNLAKSVTVE